MLAIALFLTALFNKFKQPTILAYIITGVIIGPSVFNWLGETQILEVFSHLGVSILLFMVGMHMNPRVIKDVGMVSTITGITQFVISGSVGFILANLLGFSFVSSVYVGVALTFSSTIIVLKLLSDTGETETLYGKIAIGFLIVQDILAVGALLAVNIIDKSEGLLNTIAILAVDVLGLGLLLYLVAVYILPRVTKLFASRSEHLFLFALAWCFLVASFFAYVGLSIEIGALLAGVALSISPYKHEITSKISVIRDFFLLMFFVMLGSQIDFSVIVTDWFAITLFSLSILILTPLILMSLMGLLGYTKRTSFLMGILVSQISEFSLIFVALGVSVGHIENVLLSDLTVVVLLTTAGSTYFVKYKKQLFKLCKPYMRFFFKRDANRENFGSVAHTHKHKVILFGASRVGTDLLETFKKQKHGCLVIDYNPQTVEHVKKKHVDVLYGDATDSTLLDEIDFKTVKMVASTIPDLDVNSDILKHVRSQNPDAIVICVSHSVKNTLALYELGATYVIMPHYLGGKHTSLMVEEYGFTQKHFLKDRFIHIDHLKKNGHKYPR